MSHNPTPYVAAPAAGDAAGLSAERLAEIRMLSDKPDHRAEYEGHCGYVAMALDDLLGHADALAQQVAALKAELAEQEGQMLRRDEERRRLHRAILVASSGHLSPAEREAYVTNTNGQGTRGAYGAGEIMGRVSLAQDLLALLAAPQQQEGGQPA